MIACRALCYLVFYDNSNASVSFICSRTTATALCVEMWALLNPTSRKLALGVVELTFLFFYFFKSGLTLNPHNKRHSFGLFISLYLCCVVDCINVFSMIVQSCMIYVKYLHSFFRTLQMVRKTGGYT